MQPSDARESLRQKVRLRALSRSRTRTRRRSRRRSWYGWDMASSQKAIVSQSIASDAADPLILSGR